LVGARGEAPVGLRVDVGAAEGLEGSSDRREPRLRDRISARIIALTLESAYSNASPALLSGTVLPEVTGAAKR
jgi:hypothetical protein